NGGEGKKLMTIPPHPSPQRRARVRMGSGPPTMRIPMSRKNFKYRWKSITQKSRNENQPFPNNAAHSEGANFKSSERTASRERDPSCGAAIAPLPNQLWEDMLWQRSQFIRQWTTA